MPAALYSPRPGNYHRRSLRALGSLNSCSGAYRPRPGRVRHPIPSSPTEGRASIRTARSRYDGVVRETATSMRWRGWVGRREGEAPKRGAAHSRGLPMLHRCPVSSCLVVPVVLAGLVGRVLRGRVSTSLSGSTPYQDGCCQSVTEPWQGTGLPGQCTESPTRYEPAPTELHHEQASVLTLEAQPFILTSVLAAHIARPTQTTLCNAVGGGKEQQAPR
eukprot:3069011-Rhodomonas_salina.1